MKHEFEIIRSKRKTLSVEIKRDGNIVVRAPLRMSDSQIKSFVKSKEGWIETSQIEII